MVLENQQGLPAGEQELSPFCVRMVVGKVCRHTFDPQFFFRKLPDVILELYVDEDSIPDQVQCKVFDLGRVSKSAIGFFQADRSFRTNPPFLL